MIWIVLLLLSFAVLLFICAPLYGKLPEEKTDDLSDYRDALGGIEDDAQRLHFQRRILSAAPKSLEEGASEKNKDAAVPLRGLCLGLFGFMLISAPLMYWKLGTPQISTEVQAAPPPTQSSSAAPSSTPSPQARPNAPSSEGFAERAAASGIADLSPEERAQRIQGMVEGLSARLYDTPEDAQGWLRLLRSRKVLGQEAEARAEIERMREALKGQDALIGKIISQSGWDVE